MASATPAATSAVAGFVSFTIAGLAWKLWHLGDRHEAYMVLAAMSLACLLVPVTAVSAASARMQSRQQEGKVSTLRLLGMSAATSRLLVVCEVAIPSCIGVAIGWCGSLLVAPIMDLISFGEDEGTPHPIDVRPSWEGTAVVASGLVLAAILSGIHRLNRAVNAPMSVSARDRPPIVRGTRVVVAIVALTACLSAMHLASASWGVVVIVLVLILAMLVLMSIWNLLGPYLVRRRGEPPPAQKLLSRGTRHGAGALGRPRRRMAPGLAAGADELPRRPGVFDTGISQRCDPRTDTVDPQRADPVRRRTMGCASGDHFSLHPRCVFKCRLPDSRDRRTTRPVPRSHLHGGARSPPQGCTPETRDGAIGRLRGRAGGARRRRPVPAGGDLSGDVALVLRDRPCLSGNGNSPRPLGRHRHGTLSAGHRREVKLAAHAADSASR